MGTTRSGVVGVAATVLTLAVAFFFGFPAASLVVAIGLGSGFLGLAVFLLAVGLDVSFYTVLLLFFLLFHWLACRVVGVVP